jgi:arylsulfatase A-like enzyme
MQRAVLVILDGLRPDMVTSALCPHLSALAEGATRFARHRAVFPSVTRASSASIATGCLPRTHGLAGNLIALHAEGGPVLLDAGKPDFRDRLRRLRGRTLMAPTLAERLAGHGGAIVVSNASPGAAYLQDPDGHGFVYNRGGSFAPGLVPVPDAEGVRSAKGAEGDRELTSRFCDEVLAGRDPALAVLWLSEPDSSGHDKGLGSPAHLAALAAADGCVGMVVAALERLARQGREVLLLVGSDHGQETVREVVRLDLPLARAGLIAAPDSGEAVILPQGSGALVYLFKGAAERASAIAACLAGLPEVGRVLVGPALHEAGLPAAEGLAVAVAMRAYDQPNQEGVPGLTDAAASWHKRNDAKRRLATHGGFGPNESGPLLLARGGGFAPGAVSRAQSGVIDLAPTILRHLGRDATGLDGRSLQNSRAAP